MMSLRRKMTKWANHQTVQALADWMVQLGLSSITGAGAMDGREEVSKTV
jgi:hypothetical protein